MGERKNTYLKEAEVYRRSLKKQNGYKMWRKKDIQKPHGYKMWGKKDVQKLHGYKMPGKKDIQKLQGKKDIYTYLKEAEIYRRR